MTRVSSAFINRLINDTFDAWQYRRIRVRFDAHVLLLALTLIALAVMGVGYLSTLKPITLLVNQRPLTILTNQTTVAGVLNDAAIALASEDVIFPALDASVPDNQPISIRRARPIHIQVDGDTIMRRTQSQTIVEALR